MLFRDIGDWKKNLPPDEERRLNDTIRKTLDYRQAYRHSSEPRIAQLWCAVLVLQRELTEIQSHMKRMDDIYQAIAGAVNRQQQGKQELFRSLEHY